MAIQNVRIKYKVDTSEIGKAERDIDNLTDSEKRLLKEFEKVNRTAEKTFDTIQKGSNTLNSAVTKIGSTVVAAFALDKVTDFANKVIAIRGEFQKLEAVLTNTLGSDSAAKKAIADITLFASQTNFGVVELTNSFVKLANSGFKPTVNQLRNLADVANSTGKSFDQLTEAIIDAQTGEFERLKEFGIRASKSGDDVKFTFKGVETQTKFTSAAIRDYIVGLGELNGVQGATEAISRTLVGQVSNLGDSWDQLMNTIGAQSEGILVGTISLLSDAINKANELLQTQQQLGEAQEQGRIKEQKEYVQSLVEEGLAVQFLKDKNEEYVTLFREGKNQVVQAEFRAFAQINEERVKQAEKTLRYLQLEVDQEVEITRGRTIAESRSIKQRNRDLLQAAKEYYAELTTIQKAQEAPTQKSLDDEYKKQLAMLKEREQNTIREAKVAEMSRSYLLDVERIYNVERVQLFKKYNQQNLEELRGYNIRFKELNKETKEAQIQDAIELQKVETQKIEIVKGGDQLIKDINLITAEANIKQYNEDVAAFKRAQERKKEAAWTLYNGLSNLANIYQQNQQLATQNEINENNAKRQQELKNYEGNKQAQSNINAKYDKLERQLKNEQAQRDKDTAIFNIFIATAAAVAKSLPNLYLSAVVAGLGAAEMAMVASRPVPKFKDGVEKLDGPGTETSDSILARLSKGERVVPAKTNMDYFPALTAIHNRQIPPELINGFAMNYGAIQGGSTVVVNDNSELVGEMKAINRKMDNLKQVNISIDKEGVKAYLETSYRRDELSNNYITK